MVRRERCDRHGKQQPVVRLSGRQYPVIGRLEVRRRKYLLLDRLSTGSRERYLAFDPHAGLHGRPVAICLLPRSASSRQHIQVLQRLAKSNDSVPTILDFEVQSHTTVVVLQWVRGVTLDQYLKDMQASRRPRISPVVAVQRVRTLAHGLSRWHRQRQIVHGDIRPQNVIVSRDPGRFTLIDFGSAWCAERTAIRDIGDGISSVYGAPELQNGQEFVDFRCDQFSISVIFYELIAFQVPYDGLGGKAGRPEFCKGTHFRLEPPSHLSPHRAAMPGSLWAGIDRVVMRGLALDPDQRYPTPHEWLDD